MPTPASRKVVAILEARTGEHLAGLIERLGVTALRAPALEEVPDVDLPRVESLLATFSAAAARVAIFQTGVGTRALFAALEQRSSAGLARFKADLAGSLVVVRGPKPVGELNTRGIRIDLRAPVPHTTADVLAVLASHELRGRTVLVQRYGAANEPLRAALAARGAEVLDIATYRWALPADTGPLERLVDALAAHAVDVVVFTSAVQVDHLQQVAAARNTADLASAGTVTAASHANGLSLPALLEHPLVVSIGPVCSAALARHGVKVDREATPPKLGPLVTLLEQALAPAAAQ
jgi:uroporphyrinogen-III synthase